MRGILLHGVDLVMKIVFILSAWGFRVVRIEGEAVFSFSGRAVRPAVKKLYRSGNMISRGCYEIKLQFIERNGFLLFFFSLECPRD